MDEDITENELLRAVDKVWSNGQPSTAIDDAVAIAQELDKAGFEIAPKGANKLGEVWRLDEVWIDVANLLVQFDGRKPASAQYKLAIDHCLEEIERAGGMDPEKRKNDG